MRDHVTADEITYYQDNGFVAIPDFLSAGELDDWRGGVDEAVAERGRVVVPALNMVAQEIPDDATEEQHRALYYTKVFTQRANLWQTNDRIKDLILDRRIGRVVTHLAGTEGMRIWHDQALIKEPYAHPTGFHLDVPYWSFTSPDAISIWIALDDATLSNGAMCYIPGSHKARTYDNSSIGPELDALFKVYPVWKDIAPVFHPVKAGGAVFHNGLTAHGAGANMTPGRRRAMTAGFMPDGSTFNGTQNILPAELIARLTIGDLLNDESQNPLVYSRSMDDATERAHA